MKKITVLFLFVVICLGAFAQNTNDSLAERIENMEGKLNAMEEQVTLHDNDLFKLTKVKFSGYIQAQYEDYQADLLKSMDPMNTLYIRRARIKISYEALDGVKFVLQPDFSTGNFSLKDAYAVVAIPKLRDLSLWVGQFNRLNYEVEYSSSQREVLERSRVIRNIYPGEREIGAKLEYTPVELPFKLQAAVLNGNFTGSQAKDVDSRKDLMFRGVYSFLLPSAGVVIDFGAHGYNGGLRSKIKYISDFDNIIDSTATNTGKYMDKQWAGAEMQIFIDLLGGMSLKGEYIQGKNAFAGTSKTSPNKIRKFSGFYAYFIKNIGLKHQFVARYDVFDPNTALSGDAAGSELKYSTLTLAWQYYLNDFIRISLNYEIPKNETNNKITKDLKDNVFGVRVQAKF